MKKVYIVVENGDVKNVFSNLDVEVEVLNLDDNPTLDFKVEEIIETHEEVY